MSINKRSPKDDKEDIDSENKGVRDEGVGDKDESLDPIQEEDTKNNDNSTVHKPKKENKPKEYDDVKVETVDD